MDELILISGMAIATFIIRYVPIAMSSRLVFSERFLRSLRYVPPVVLTAIIVPDVLIPNRDTIQISYTNARLLGAIAAVWIGWHYKNLLLTITAGMTVFFLAQWILNYL